MALDEPNDQIETRTINEIDILISDEILPFTNDNLLDYVSDSRGEGFTLGPANGESGCC
jgi:Fe-S cluster assembly iron-binding protein IscA